MPSLTIRKTLALAFLAATCAFAETGPNEVDGPNVRVMRNEDGSRTIFTRSPDNLTLTKITYTANGVRQMTTIYRMDHNENPLSCKIFDGQKQELFKVRYGYRKSDGKLVEEQMFDSRVKRINPANGEEMPVRRFIYTYDAQGKRSVPIAITLTPGKTAKDIYGSPSAIDHNPFRDPPNPLKTPGKKAGQ
jgi:hypothetical protein